MQSLIEIGPIQKMIGNQIVTHNSVFSIILQLFFFLYALAHNEPRSMNLNQHASIILQHCLLALAVLCTTLFYRYSVLLKGTRILHLTVAASSRSLQLSASCFNWAASLSRSFVTCSSSEDM